MKRGESQRAEFGWGESRCQPLSPPKAGVTIGTDSAGQGWEEEEGESWPNSQDGKRNGKGVIKNATLEPTGKVNHPTNIKKSTIKD